MEIILTGSTGFLGRTIMDEISSTHSLKTLGRIYGDIITDLSNERIALPSSELVIHSAGKAHVVPKTEQEKKEFFTVNVIGTQNLLKGLEKAPSLPSSFVFISSVAVYGLERGTVINESHPLNAKDAYGLSKIQAEQVVKAWCEKNHVICTILRLPLLVGKNPPGNLGAMINALRKGFYFNIAGGTARKSMVMADDVAKYIMAASKVGGVYNLTDGYHPNFDELSKKLAEQLNKHKPFNMPNWLAMFVAKTGDLFGKKFPFNSYKLAKITADLTFDDRKARSSFGWNPKNVLENFKL